MATIPQNKVKYWVATTYCFSDFKVTLRLYKSIDEVAAKEFNPEALEDMAALIITASNNHNSPFGK